MAWLYLIVAGLLEIGWPVGLKMSQQPDSRWLGIAIAVAFMVASGFMLWLAQKDIPMGTSYAVWTGIGVAASPYNKIPTKKVPAAPMPVHTA